MSFLREIVEGTARKELKQRVDEILEANAQFRKSINRLSDFLESLSEGGENSRLVTALGGLKGDLKENLEKIRASQEELVQAINGRHFRSIDRLIRFLDKRL